MICECAEDKLEDSRENTIEQLDDDAESFLERLEKLKQDKEETMMKVSERDTIKEDQELTVSCSNYRLDKFTKYPDLKPQFLKKEANLIEVNTWIRQITHFIQAGYRNRIL